MNRDHGRHHFTATGETRVYSGVPAVVESCTLCGHRRLRPLPEVPGCGHCLAGRHDRCRTCECCSCLVSR